MEIPKKVATHSMAEALELHIAVARESGHVVILSDNARRKLLEGLMGQEKQMKLYGHTRDVIRDTITCAIWAFVNGYETGREERG